MNNDDKIEWLINLLILVSGAIISVPWISTLSPHLTTRIQIGLMIIALFFHLLIFIWTPARKILRNVGLWTSTLFLIAEIALAIWGTMDILPNEPWYKRLPTADPALPAPRTSSDFNLQNFTFSRWFLFCGVIVTILQFVSMHFGLYGSIVAYKNSRKEDLKTLAEEAMQALGILTNKVDVVVEHSGMLVAVPSEGSVASVDSALVKRIANDYIARYSMSELEHHRKKLKRCVYTCYFLGTLMIIFGVVNTTFTALVQTILGVVNLVFTNSIVNIGTTYDVNFNRGYFVIYYMALICCVASFGISGLGVVFPIFNYLIVPVLLVLHAILILIMMRKAAKIILRYVEDKKQVPNLHKSIQNLKVAPEDVEICSPVDVSKMHLLPLPPSVPSKAVSGSRNSLVTRSTHSLTANSRQALLSGSQHSLAGSKPLLTVDTKIIVPSS